MKAIADVSGRWSSKTPYFQKLILSSLGNKKRRNEDARDCVCGSMRNAEVLTKTCGRQKELKNVDEKEVLHCQHALSVKNHCKK